MTPPKDGLTLRLLKENIEREESKSVIRVYNLNPVPNNTSQLLINSKVIFIKYQPISGFVLPWDIPSRCRESLLLNS
jgi:hypothetical protein